MYFLDDLSNLYNAFKDTYLLVLMEHPKDPPLDEIQWRSPMDLQQMGGFIHTNTGLIFHCAGEIHAAILIVS